MLRAWLWALYDPSIHFPRRPEPGSSHLGTFSMSPGGKGANEAVALSRLGVPTTLIGRVGKDEMGRALLEQLKSQVYRGLDCSGVRSSADASTGVAVLFVTAEDGQKGTVVCQGANGAVGDDEVDAVLKLLPEPPLPGVTEADPPGPKELVPEPIRPSLITGNLAESSRALLSGGASALQGSSRALLSGTLGAGSNMLQGGVRAIQGGGSVLQSGVSILQGGATILQGGASALTDAASGALTGVSGALSAGASLLNPLNMLNRSIEPAQEKPPIIVMQLELPIRAMLYLAQEARVRGCLVVLKVTS